MGTVKRAIDCGDGLYCIPRFDPRFDRFISREAFAKINHYDQLSDFFQIGFIRTLEELRGIFDRGELMLIVDTANGTFLGPSVVFGISLIATISDGIKMGGLGEKWNVSRETIMTKLEALPAFSLMCLEVWAYMFWYCNPESIEIDSWIEDLLTS